MSDYESAKKLFVRHGETRSAPRPGDASSDPGLSEAATEKAYLLGDSLRGRGVRTDRIATSPRLRARQTAYALGDGRADIVIYQSLAEVPAEPHGPTAEQLKEELQNGQVPKTALARAYEFSNDTLPEEYLCVSHGVFIAGLRALAAMRRGEDPVGQNLSLEHLEAVEIDLWS